MRTGIVFRLMGVETILLPNYVLYTAMCTQLGVIMAFVRYVLFDNLRIEKTDYMSVLQSKYVSQT